MGLITYEGQRGFMIPDDSREKWFDLSDEIIGVIPFNDRPTFMDVYNDPIVILDFSMLSNHNAKYLEAKLFMMGAKEITKTLID